MRLIGLDKDTTKIKLGLKRSKCKEVRRHLATVTVLYFVSAAAATQCCFILTHFFNI
jgi:uncharacterized protein (UPF0216 family)